MRNAEPRAATHGSALDTPPGDVPAAPHAGLDPALAIFTRLVRRQVGVPLSLVSLTEDIRPLFGDGDAALPDPHRVSEAFSGHVSRSGEPLVVADATGHSLPGDVFGVPDHAVVAYAGMPLTDEDGRTLGVLCAIDHTARHWTEGELDTLRDLAAACSAEVRLRVAVARADAARQEAEAARREAEQARARAEQAGARLDLMARVTRETAIALDADVALRRLADLLVPALGDWCVLDLLEDDLVRRVAVKHQRPEVTIERLGRRQLPADTADPGPLTSVLRGDRSRRVLRLDELRWPPPGHDSLHDAQMELFQVLGGHTALFSALPGRRQIRGALTLVRSDDRPPFAIEELTVLDEVARRAGLSLDTTTLYQSQRRAAETLQASLLTTLPDSPGLQLCARYQPASAGADVGGDWYDAFTLAGGETMLVIGDVTGHDLDAASRMGQLRNMLRTLAADRRAAPSELLGRLDRVAAELRIDALATCVAGVVRGEDRRAGRWRFTWSNAGHLPPVLLTAAGDSRVLDGEPDLMLGIDVDTTRQDREVVLEPGDTVLMVTDGLVERRGASLDDGLGALRRHAEAAAGVGLDELCERLVAAAADTTDSDDVAAIAVRVPVSRRS